MSEQGHDEQDQKDHCQRQGELVLQPYQAATCRKGHESGSPQDGIGRALGCHD